MRSCKRGASLAVHRTTSGVEVSSEALKQANAGWCSPVQTACWGGECVCTGEGIRTRRTTSVARTHGFVETTRCGQAARGRVLAVAPGDKAV